MAGTFAASLDVGLVFDPFPPSEESPNLNERKNKNSNNKNYSVEIGISAALPHLTNGGLRAGI